MEQALRNEIGDYCLVDSTLREGEQFAGARFTTSHKVHIAELLDDVGVEYIELSSPASSAVTLEDHKILMELDLSRIVWLRKKVVHEQVYQLRDARVNLPEHRPVHP